MKFGIEPKPVEYEPLTVKLLQSRGDFGPLEFSISEESHKKTLTLLNRNTEVEPLDLGSLLPSELWGCARVLSNYFGRLNEVAISRTQWVISGKAFPTDTLTARSRVVKTELRKGLPFALVETTTADTGGNTLMSQLDELLLFHEVIDWAYKERFVADELSTELSIPRTVYFRHNWDPSLWKNNIHTNNYARKFGYELGLPEFIMYMDWVWDALFRIEGERAYNYSLDIPIILPIYEGDKIDVRMRKQDSGYKVTFTKGNFLRLKGLVCPE